jgi:hypothetical protein
LVGRKFRLITDNRAVELIFRNQKSNPPLRIKRWVLRLMDYDFTIIHKPGAYNIADFLSRHPVEANDCTGTEEDTRSYVAFVTGYSIPKSMSNDEVIESTKLDEELQLLICLIKNDSCSVQNKIALEKVKSSYNRVFEELCVNDEGVVLRGHRIVLPESLRMRALKIAHEGHQGVSKTKALVRTKIWFPGIDQLVEDLMADCLQCELNDKTTNHQPIQSTEMPTQAWVHLAMDFYGPLENGNELMVVVDEFSRMPVVEEIKSTAAEYVLPKLEALFSFVGVPKVLKTDNGPPFNGHKFTEFAEFFNFKHRKITPLHPAANGQAEKFMLNLSKVMIKSKITNSGWRQELCAFLRSYRSTPHTTTGVSPSVLLFGANRMNRLPSFECQSDASYSDSVHLARFTYHHKINI